MLSVNASYNHYHALVDYEVQSILILILHCMLSVKDANCRLLGSRHDVI